VRRPPPPYPSLYRFSFCSRNRPTPAAILLSRFISLARLPQRLYCTFDRRPRRPPPRLGLTTLVKPKAASRAVKPPSRLTPSPPAPRSPPLPLLFLPPPSLRTPLVLIGHAASFTPY